MHIEQGMLGKKWRIEIDRPWERSWCTPLLSLVPRPKNLRLGSVDKRRQGIFGQGTRLPFTPPRPFSFLSAGMVGSAPRVW